MIINAEHEMGCEGRKAEVFLPQVLRGPPEMSAHRTMVDEIFQLKQVSS
jgi:hypothetical protein